MSLARTWSVAVTGVDGRVVEVEADLSPGLPGCAIVGLPDASLNEARDRVRAAVVNSGLAWPGRRITIGLSPASVPKRGSGFDLAVAVAVLAASGHVPVDALEGVVLVGELGLDGRTRPVAGMLPCAVAASRTGRGRLVCPTTNAAEALLVRGLDVVAVSSLGQLVGVLRGEAEPDDVRIHRPAPEPVGPGGADLAEVMGQLEARRALEVAAAGAHHLLLLGPPGTGKTMLAERLPGLLPELDDDAALEVTAVHSVAGVLRAGSPLVSRAPFVAPHHTATVPSLVGGGSAVAHPGAVSLAHRGVLFLDEAPEFSPRALESLREPLESGLVTVSRSGFHVAFPARFQLVLAANPCPCGGGSTSTTTGSTFVRSATCRCTPQQKRRYASRLSGPLLDRVDLSVAVDPVDRAALLSFGRTAESSAAVAGRVAEARERAGLRWRRSPWATNAEIPASVLRSTARPDDDALAVVDSALRRGGLSARGLAKVLRVAWTLADLHGAERPGVDEVREAVALRASVVEGAA